MMNKKKQTKTQKNQKKRQIMMKEDQLEPQKQNPQREESERGKERERENKLEPSHKNDKKKSLKPRNVEKIHVFVPHSSLTSLIKHQVILEKGEEGRSDGRVDAHSCLKAGHVQAGDAYSPAGGETTNPSRPGGGEGQERRKEEEEERDDGEIRSVWMETNAKETNDTKRENYTRHL